MKNVFLISIIFFIFSPTQVIALEGKWRGNLCSEWGFNDHKPPQWVCLSKDYEIGDIFGDVADVAGLINEKSTLGLVGADSLERLMFWEPQFPLIENITDVMRDLLGWIEPIITEYYEFTLTSPGSEESCVDGSRCQLFKGELKSYFEDLAGLKTHFPVIEKVGLGKFDKTKNVIDMAPGILLYGLDQVLTRGGDIETPDWLSLPTILGDLYYDLGQDDEVFKLEFGASTESARSGQAVAAYGNTHQTTINFCSVRSHRIEGIGDAGLVDPIEMNRTLFQLNVIKGVVSLAGDQIPDDTDIMINAAFGAGTALPNAGITFPFSAVGLVIDSVLLAIDTHQKNLSICMDRFDTIEGNLASCKFNTDFHTNTFERQEYYSLVNRRLLQASLAGFDNSQAEQDLRTSNRKRLSGDFRQAYDKLCGAYQKIGAN